MSERKLATVETILDVQPIPNADNIVKAKVRNWWVVVGKDQFNIGDKCIYFEIDSLLPINNSMFNEILGKYNTIKTMVTDEGKEVTGYRIRTVKLRGQISQGLILPISLYKDLEIGTDLTEELGVVKYDPYIYQKGAQLQSDNGAEGLFPNFIPKTDEERVQNLNIEDIYGKRYVLTEKLDGTSFTAYKYNNEFKVCSRNLILREDENSVYWKMAKKYDIENKIPNNIAIQGEIVGPGIQGNPLKLKEIELYLFYTYNIEMGQYVSFSVDGVKKVPIISCIEIKKVSIDDLIDNSYDLKSILNPNAQAEGIVYSHFEDGCKFSFKVINNKFLLKEK